jgi:hypothetical protein
MWNQYETPELTLLGEAADVVMGSGIGGNDFPKQFATDFEFERD